MEHFFSQWIALSKIELNFDSLKELILGEQFLHSCPRDLALFIGERTPTDVSEMMKLTTVYTDSRAAAGMRQDKIMATPPMSKPPDRTSNPGNGQKVFPPRMSREPMRCFLFNEMVTKLSSVVRVDHHRTLRLTPGLKIEARCMLARA